MRSDPSERMVAPLPWAVALLDLGRVTSGLILAAILIRWSDSPDQLTGFLVGAGAAALATRWLRRPVSHPGRAVLAAGAVFLAVVCGVLGAEYTFGSAPSPDSELGDYAAFGTAMWSAAAAFVLATRAT